MKRINILDLSFEELDSAMLSVKEKKFRSQQIANWIFDKGALSFDQMKNFPTSLKDNLKESYDLDPLQQEVKKVSEDGTTKFLFRLHDDQRIETVLIPTKTRTTICISTQAGCKFACRFCASGIGGWKRNLSVAEILAQIIYVKTEAKKHPNPLSHIVFMGVGEPMDNYENLMKAIRMINHPQGFNIGARRITVSTCGVIPRILEMGQEGIQIELAISLHGYDNESRNVLMPVNKKYPFEALIKACKEYQNNYRRQITFEYILIKDITCSEKAVRSLQKSLKGLICKMNLIPYNPVSEFDHQTPSRQDMLSFKNQLQKSGIHATIRMPRGKDINSACGQLRHSQ